MGKSWNLSSLKHSTARVSRWRGPQSNGNAKREQKPTAGGQQTKQSSGPNWWVHPFPEQRNPMDPSVGLGSGLAWAVQGDLGSGLAWPGLGRPGVVWAGLAWFGLRAGLAWSGRVWNGLNWIWQVTAGLDWFGPIWIVLVRAGLGRSGLVWVDPACAGMVRVRAGWSGLF